jgi:hypothetical protein
MFAEGEDIAMAKAEWNDTLPILVFVRGKILSAPSNAALIVTLGSACTQQDKGAVVGSDAAQSSACSVDWLHLGE